MQVVLVMFRPDGQRRSFSVTREVTVVGRREDCDLRIPLGEVSRKHCRLVKDGDAVRLEDLGSSNGTFHNGERVREADLQPGDSLAVGPVTFTVQINGVPADEEMTPPTDSAATFGGLPTQEYVAPGPQGQDKLGDMASVITDVEESPRSRAGHASDDVERLQAMGSEGEDVPTELEEVTELEPAGDEEVAELEPVADDEAAELEPVEEEVAELEPIEEEAEEVAELEPLEEASEGADELVALEEADPAAAGEEEPVALEEVADEESPAEVEATEELAELESADEAAAEAGAEELAELEPIEEPGGEIVAAELEEVTPVEGEVVAEPEEVVDDSLIHIEHEEDQAPVSAQEMTEPEEAAPLEPVGEGTAVGEEVHLEEEEPQDDLVDLDLHDSRKN